MQRKLDIVLNWRKKGNNQGDISLTLKKAGPRQFIYRIKRSDGTNKYDIDSIMNEHFLFLLQTCFQ